MAFDTDMCRVYVVLDIYKLQSQYLSLRERTRSLRSKAQLRVTPTEAEGYELQEKSDSNSTTTTTPASSGMGISTAAGPPKLEVSADADVAGLQKEWRVWQLASLKNVYVHHQTQQPINQSLHLLPSSPCLFYPTISSFLLLCSRRRNGAD